MAVVPAEDKPDFNLTATTAMSVNRSTDIRPFSPFDNDHESEMQAFVHQHLLRLLSPLTDNVRSLQADLQDLKYSFSKKAYEIGASTAKLTEHDLRLSTVANNWNESLSNMSKMKSDLFQMIELQAKANRERCDASLLKVDEELRRFTEELHLTKKSCDIQVDKALQETKDVYKVLAEHDSKISRLQEYSEYLNHCQLGMSSRLEKSKQLGDDTHQQLQKYMSSSTSQGEELKRTSSRLQNRIESLETRVYKNKQDAFHLSADIKATNASLAELHRAMNGFITDSSLGIETTATPDENSTSLSMKTVVDRLAEELKTTKKELELLTSNMHEKIVAQLKELQATVLKDSTRINEQGAAAESMKSSLMDYAGQVKQIQKKVQDQGSSQERLKQDLDSFDTSMKGLSSSFEDLRQKLEAHSVEFAMMDERMKTDEAFLEATRSGLNSVSGKLNSTNEDVTGVISRLNVCHDYLAGIGRGLQEAQRRAHAGQDGMLPHKDPDKSNFLPTLPSLPTNLPRKPPIL